MATVSELNTLIDSASSSIAAGNYSSAWTALLQAQAILVAIPDGAAQGFSQAFARENIENLLRRVEAARNRGLGTNGIQRSNINYTRATANADGT